MDDFKYKAHRSIEESHRRNVMESRNVPEELSLEGLELLLGDEQAGIKEFDAADYLEDPASIAAYLTRMLENDDDSRIASALGDVARSAGMAKVAQQTGIGREALYKALRNGATPRLKTVNSVVKALGMKIVIVADSPPKITHNYRFADEVVPEVHMAI